MEILDLDIDTLRCIFGFVAQSGGEHIARAMTVCKVFRELGNDTDILKSAVFSNTAVSDNLHVFQQFNSVLRKAAEVGSMTAQFLLAKIILLSSTQLLVPKSGSEDEDDKVVETETLASMFLSNFESANSENPSKNLHHYHFVSVFWANCTPHDISEMSTGLRCYYIHFADSRSCVNSLFSKFIGTAEMLSNFLRGMDVLQKYVYGVMVEPDNQEVETMAEAPNQEEHEQHYDIVLGHFFIIKCRRLGKLLQKLKSERPDDKELFTIVDEQLELFKVRAESLTSAYEERRAHMLPVIHQSFCDSMELDPFSPESLM